MMIKEQVIKDTKFQMKDYNVMIDGKIFFDQPVRNDKVTYGNI